MQMVFREGLATPGGANRPSSLDYAPTMASSWQQSPPSSIGMLPQIWPTLPPSLSSSSSAAAAATAGASARLSVEEQRKRQQQGISLNYRGDIDNPHNRGDHVPDGQNTSLFLTNLPSTATVGELLCAIAALGPTGRIYSASVTPPDPSRGHRRAAAKISFFTRAQAERLKLRIDNGELVMAGSDGGSSSSSSSSSASVSRNTGHNSMTNAISAVESSAASDSLCQIRAIWNRDKKGPRVCIQPNECRVLSICGPAAIVNYSTLTAYFRQKFYYELENVCVVSSWRQAGLQTMEWRFASFQSQAIAAKMALNHEWKIVTVEYGTDPCE